MQKVWTEHFPSFWRKQKRSFILTKTKSCPSKILVPSALHYLHYDSHFAKNNEPQRYMRSVKLFYNLEYFVCQLTNEYTEAVVQLDNYRKSVPILDGS